MLIKTKSENGTMEKEPTLNRAGNKGSHIYIKNAENTTELIPLSGTETWHVEEMALTEVDEDDPPSDTLPQTFLPQNDSFTELSALQSTRLSSVGEILPERSVLSDKGTMEGLSALNRAGNRGSSTYKTNAVNATELIPLSRTKIKRTACSEIDETNQLNDTPSQRSLPQNDSYPVLCVTVPSTPDSTRSSSPQELHKMRAALSDNRAKGGKIDSISISLSEYQLLDPQERKPHVSFNSAHPERSISESATEEAEGTKFTTLAPPTGEAKEEDEQVLEVLRTVVRKCTTLEPIKRPSSDLVHSLLFSSLRRNM